MNDELAVEWVCRNHPERVRALFEALDLDSPGLSAVRQAAESENLPEACRALLEYYREGTTANWLRGPLPEPGEGTIPEAEAVRNDTFTFYTLTDRVPRTDSGGLDWHYRGPNDDKEWAWALNRHFHLARLLEAYRKTGNPIYVRCIDEHIRDWVTANRYPGEQSSTGPWRGLEAHFRVRHWAQVFYALQGAPEFSPVARVLLLSSIPEHAHYLRHFHAAAGNWVAMEMHALAVAGACWPEFREAKSWVQYATTRMCSEISQQVYPDGTQKELTSGYHWVTLANFESFAETVEKAGFTLPTEFPETIERMWNYLAHTIRPDGYGPLNNDSDRAFNRERVIQRAREPGREDWIYIATNGSEGKPPEGQPSIFFPWAGQLIMRSGWDADAHWAFFDVGPMGIGHRHWDKLHLSIAAYGRDILVDSGRYTYVGGPFRKYFVGSAAHNLILVDGHGQKEHAWDTDKPLTDRCRIENDYDVAQGTFDDGYEGVEGKAIHSRAVVYLRGKYWIVVDTIETDRPRKIQTLWHFHPECTVTIQGDSVLTTDPDKGNLRIVPSRGLNWEVHLVEGQEEPEIQGWWSRGYNHKEPCATAVYSTEIEKTTTLAWVLAPARGPVGDAFLNLTEQGKDELGIQVTGDEIADSLVISLAGVPEVRFVSEKTEEVGKPSSEE